MRTGSTPKVFPVTVPLPDATLTCPPPGAWTIHFVLIAALKILYVIIPGVSQELSWTLTNVTYIIATYIMFHYVRGVPFEFNSGAYDNLTMWEQIDDGAQYTPAKKFLLSVPIVLFLLSTHYTHYDLKYFTFNFIATLAAIVPKLPFVSPPPSVLETDADSHAHRATEYASGYFRRLQRTSRTTRIRKTRADFKALGHAGARDWSCHGAGWQASAGDGDCGGFGGRRDRGSARVARELDARRKAAFSGETGLCIGQEWAWEVHLG